MFELKISLEGIEKIPDLTGKKLDELTRAVAMKVRSEVVKLTPRDTGKAKTSWTQVSKIEGGWSFGNPMVYAKYLEKGSEIGQRPWPSAGPRTVEQGGRIYSSQAPLGILEQIQLKRLAKIEFKKVMKGL